MVIILNYKNILFDLDGTLTDPADGITNSVAYALRHYGIEAADRSALCAFIGPPLAYSFNKYYGFDQKQCLEAIGIYREYFSVKGKFENSVYDGIIPTLQALRNRGFRLFIATSKPQKFALEIAEHFGFEKYFEAIRGIPMNGENISKGQVIGGVLREFSLDVAKTLMVGDRSYDVLGAKENGLSCIGVLYGYGSKSELKDAGADYIIENVNKLTKFFEDK